MTDKNTHATPHTNQEDIQEDKGERIAKALARAGVGSRREIERLIEAGRVSHNGETLTTAAYLVKSLEGITVDGETVQQGEATKLWRMHKRRGTLTTHKDPEGRQTVFDNLPNHMGRVISIGRLDMNTEGLLLLTNDGALARWMELPNTALVRKYRVRVHGRITQRDLDKLKDGVTIEGIHYGEIIAKLEKRRGDEEKSSANTWLTVAIKEGKNREVRRVMDHLGLSVNRLIRTHYGPFSLGTLPREAVAEIPVKQLYETLPEFFDQAGASVAAPTQKIDKTKWAKAKVKTGNKPGAKRRKAFHKSEEQNTRSDRPNRTSNRHAKKTSK